MRTLEKNNNVDLTPHVGYFLHEMGYIRSVTVYVHLLEPPLAVLALISNPSSITDA